MEFVAEPAEGGLSAELERLQPANPFATAAYLESMRLLGCSTWVLGLRHPDKGLESGCAAVLREGRLNQTLEIPSLPNLSAESAFWQGFRDFCRFRRITRVELGTYASPPGTDPPLLGSHGARKSRCEFVLDLSGDLAAMLGRTHRRWVRKAERAGLTVLRARSAEATDVHQKMMNHSLERRRYRGEEVGSSVPSPEIVALLQSGAGELFQSTRGGTVFSSVLVLRAAKGGYYQSAGTSSEGMGLGASHFLNHHIAVELKRDGAEIFNLGGADPDSTLGSFKEGFGAVRVPLSSASCYVGPGWRYKVGRALELIRSDRKKLCRLLRGEWSSLLVYAADTEGRRTPEPQDGLEFRALTEEEVRALPAADPLFRARQLERLRRFGASHAYGVVAEGHVVHVSWLLPSEAMEKDPPHVIRPQPAVAEITACETVPEFRGRGIYGYAIRNLLALARENGVRRVFMKTAPSNRASQTGIEKAGLRRVGSALLITPPLTQRQRVWRRFR